MMLMPQFELKLLAALKCVLEIGCVIILNCFILIYPYDETLKFTAADYLTDHGFIPILIDCIYKDDVNIVAIHLETLNNLMYNVTGIEEGIVHGGYEAFVIDQTKI